ncbi:arsenate reductase/protein-tyrosine-phosphatase family protein [Alteromonas gilva]|uniref:protein-tyrosine-phosphatase n=1 Tax=Alteromonas gilva TaxID=2987522 RepID=A0ABT5KZZ1_9ALTE|nr:ATP-grasp domain-containing protein [Alteromonas gilva]MDC8830345.1 ATP-grasp domain-containing protein [Alteromonas gilva]
MISALVLGEDTRSFLSVIRSLGEMGIFVDVVCYDQTSPALKSKWINKAWFYNYQAYTSDQWITAVAALIEKNAYSMVFPCDERAIYPLLSNREKLNGLTKLALPNKSVRDNLFDKHLTREVAESCGVRVARGDLLSLENTQYALLRDKYTSKFVIKPTESFSENKLSSRNKVAIISNEQEYVHYLQHSDIVNQQFLVEEYFSGTGEGISLMACKGHVQYLFAHTRVNEPRSGGGSSYRKAIPVDKAMADACIAMCAATDYDGVGMFEFKRNRTTGEWILIEVNARFWGSLPLAIHAGIDFPRHYANYLMGNYELKRTPVTDYNTNAYARSFTNDIYDIRGEMQYLWSTVNPFAATLSAVKRLGSLARVVSSEKIDSYDASDKQPFAEEFRQLLNATVIDKLARQFPQRHSNTSMNALLRALYTLEGQGRLVFVCYGNIMRSPLAAEFSAIFLRNTQLHFTVDSFGFHQHEDRQSPQECIAAARFLGIDLTTHRSKRLLQSHLTDNDIVFIFDQKNQHNIDKYYDVKYVFNLADFVPAGLGQFNEITDPYGSGQEAVNRCYLLIIEALKNVFERYLVLKA